MGGWSLPLIVVKTQKRKSVCGVDGTQTRIPHRMVSVLSLNLQPLPPVPLAPHIPQGLWLVPPSAWSASIMRCLNRLYLECCRMITYFVNVIVASTALALVMETGLHQSLRIDWILSQVCSLLLSCSQHVNELALCSRGWIRTRHRPLSGVFCS